MSHLYDKYIVSSIKKGDECVFEVFFKAEFDNLAYFANKYLNDSLLAYDVAQETFITLWSKRELLDEDLNIRAYVFTIAKNKALNLLRQKYMTVTDSIQNKEVEVNIKYLENSYITDKINSMQLETLIQKTYENLPDKIKESFALNRFEGLTYKEVAEKKGVPVKAVEYQIKQALIIFRKKLREFLMIFI